MAATSDINHNEHLTFYPAYCHPVSPTYFTWVKIAAIDAHCLQTRSGFEGQNLYFHQNHPIQFIHLAGIITARDELPARTIFLLDDSSGETIEVVCPKIVGPNTSGTTGTPTTTTTPPSASAPDATHRTSKTSTPLNLTPLQAHTRAKVKGTITTFRGVKQVSLERFTVLEDMAEEVRFWDERSRFLVDVLSVPWVVGEGEVRRLRDETMQVEGVGAESGKGERGGAGVGGGRERNGEKGRDVERKKRRVEREERDRLKIERRYAREEQLRYKLAMKCRAASAAAVAARTEKR